MGLPGKRHYSLTIPGLPTEASEYVPRKAWWKRLTYRAAVRSARLDRATHRRLFRQWFAEAGLEEISVTRRTGNSWRGHGRRAAG